MAPALRVYALASIAVVLGFLVLRARDPIRLGVGDPTADAIIETSIARVTHDGFHATSFGDLGDIDPASTDVSRTLHAPALGELVYGAVGRYLGARDVATFRLLALACSVLAMWLFFQYARRLWSAQIALIATALCATSVIWTTTADGLGPAPLTQATGFLALWGLVRALETAQRRHLAAVALGTVGCFLASRDYWVFLPVAAIFTVHARRGDPLTRGHRRALATCLAGCAVGLLIKALLVHGATEAQPHLKAVLGHAAGVLRPRAVSSLPTLIRRYTLGLTPLVWIALGATLWRAVRAASPRTLIEDRASWLVALAAVASYVDARLNPAPLLGSQAVLPCYALAAAIVLHRLFEGPGVRRALAAAWLLAAPAWTLSFVLGQPRAVLGRDDVARVNAYLASSDRNDFVVSNLLADGPLELAFRRHGWPAPDGRHTGETPLKILELLETAGTDYVHAVVFTTPESRFNDRSLWALAVPRRQWSVSGWPQLFRGRAAKEVRAYDKRVRDHLDAVGAQRVLQLANFDVYRIDRASVLAAIGRSVPVVHRLDFGSIAANPHKLLGWGDPWLRDDAALAVASIIGHASCANPPRLADGPTGSACRTTLTRSGLRLLDEGHVNRAQLMIRVERACDLRLTVELAGAGLIRVAVDDFTAGRCAPASQFVFDIPQRAVRAGLNVITFERRIGPKDLTADVASLIIEPRCEPDEPERPR